MLKGPLQVTEPGIHAGGQTYHWSLSLAKGCHLPCFPPGTPGQRPTQSYHGGAWGEASSPRDPRRKGKKEGKRFQGTSGVRDLRMEVLLASIKPAKIKR